MVVEHGGVRKCFCNINVKKLVRFFSAANDVQYHRNVRRHRCLKICCASFLLLVFGEGGRKKTLKTVISGCHGGKHPSREGAEGSD